MRKLLLSLSVLALAGLASCSSSTDPEPEKPSIKAGSTFQFHHELTFDTLWTDVASIDTVTYTVASIDSSVNGMLKSHFLTAMNDTTIYQLESNGNLSMYQPAIAIPGSEIVFPESRSILPVVTKEPSITDLDEDTVVVFGGFAPGRVQMYRSSGYIGTGSLKVDDKTYETVETFVESRVEVTVQGTSYYTTVRTEYGYSSELKTFITRRQKVWSNHDNSPLPNGGEIWKLVKFTI